MAQGPPGFAESSYSEYGVIIFAVLLIVGIIIAFAGRIVWRHLMSFIGAILGGIFGFILGTAVGGALVGLMVSILCAIVGSFVFIFLAEIGLGVVAAMFTFFVVEAVVGNEIVALVIAGLVLAITIIFIEQALGVVTAGIGGLLVGLALIWLDWLDMAVVMIIMFGTIIFGAAFQLAAIKEQARVGGAVPPVATAAAMQGAPAPETPPLPGRTCPSCGGPLEYIPEYNRYYCYRCQRYE